MPLAWIERPGAVGRHARYRTVAGVFEQLGIGLRTGSERLIARLALADRH